jgi:hypothetical protein
MKALVIIFALLGILGSVGLGAVFSSVAKDDSAKSDSVSTRAKEIDELVGVIKDSDEVSAADRKEMVAGLESLKLALVDMQKIPIPLFVSAGLGLLMMILAIANAGPRPLHGVGFLIAGILPGAWTYFMVVRPVARGAEMIAKLSPKLGGGGADAGPAAAAQATGPLLAMVSAGAAAFLLAGLFAFFVKRKVAQVATAAAAPAPAPLA